MLRAKKHGCFALAFSASLIMLFLCALVLVLYVLFTPAPINILIVGLDAREGEGVMARTDAIAILGVQTQRNQVALLSIPRDLFLSVPNYGLQRINTVHVLGEMEATGQGMPLLSTSIEQNFRIPIQRTVRINFQGFIALIDALGGVEIEVPRLLIDHAYPTADYGTISVRFEAGHQQLTGEQALIYARMRHADDDYGRAGRQQQVIQALGAKLANPLNWGRAWSALHGTLETNLSLIDGLSLLPTLVLNAGRYHTQVINRDLIVAGERGAQPNYDALEPVLAQFFRP